MGQFDIAFRRVGAWDRTGIASLVLRRHDLSVLPLDTALQALERGADFAVRVETPSEKPFILHVECERDPYSKMASRLIRYRSLLSLREENVSVLSALVRLEGPGPAYVIKEHRETVAGIKVLVFRYPQITLSRLDAEEILAAEHLGLVAFTPLGRGGGRREIMRAAVDRIRQGAPNAEVRADLLAAMAVFAGRGAGAQLVRTLVRREEMKESVIYQEIFEEGKVEGKAEGKAEAIVGVLERRFGPVPAPLQARLLLLHDSGALAACLDAAVSAASLAEFERLAPPA